MTHKDREQTISRRSFMRDGGLFLAGLGAGIGGMGTFFLLQEEAEKKSLPQGMWGENTYIDGTILHAEVTAYSNDPHTAIERVDLTVQDQNQDWRNVCRMTVATRTDTFVCEIDIGEYLASGQQVLVGFNVLDTQGRQSKSPHGLRQLSHQGS